MAPASPYLVWKHKPVGNSCMLCPPEGISRSWELSEGVARSSAFPADACFRMSPDHPRDIALTDNPMNLARLVVGSERLVDALRQRTLRNVEYLPVRIIDHRNRVASDRYFIVNPTDPQDCLDIAASTPHYSHICPGDIVSVDRLVVDGQRVEQGLEMFRIKDFWSPVVVRRELADALSAAGLSGLWFTELDQYRG